MGKIFTGWEAEEPPDLTITSDETEPLKARFTMPSVNVIVRGKFKDDNPYGYVYEDIGGKTYPTVKIGNQVWMAENLDYSKIPYSNYYNGASSPPFEKAGRLYFCYRLLPEYMPAGWHAPTDSEWTTLFKQVGGTGTYGTDGDAGKHLMATSGWNGDSNGLDTYGFAGLPAGSGGPAEGGVNTYSNLGTRCNWCSSSWASAGEGSMSDSYRYRSITNAGIASRNSTIGRHSVRLVKDLQLLIATLLVCFGFLGTSAHAESDFGGGGKYNG
jgi:uncharacterized protein (TIGR02145 family)